MDRDTLGEISKYLHEHPLSAYRTTRAPHFNGEQRTDVRVLGYWTAARLLYKADLLLFVWNNLYHSDPLDYQLTWAAHFVLARHSLETRGFVRSLSTTRGLSEKINFPTGAYYVTFGESVAGSPKCLVVSADE